MSLLDLLFPKYCLGCHQTGQYFCPVCLAKLKAIPQICPVCEKPSPFGQTHPYCQTRYSLDGLFSFFTYEGIIRNAIHKLKYKLVTDLQKELFSVILRQKERQEALDKFIAHYKPIIIPIPLYWYKHNQRGFNQSSLFGQFLAKRYSLPFSEKILLRQHSSISQTKLSLKERKQNVREAFIVNSNYKIQTTSYLLVDDVWTTGSTLKTATSLLKHSGTQKVWGLTIAR